MASGSPMIDDKNTPEALEGHAVFKTHPSLPNLI